MGRTMGAMGAKMRPHQFAGIKSGKSGARPLRSSAAFRSYVSQGSFDEPTCVFRGDLSPIQGRDNAIRELKRLYPGCKVRIDK